MKRAVAGMALAFFSLPSACALAQGARDASAVRQPPAPPHGAAAARDWLVSETMSPVDYSPVVVASAFASSPDGVATQLSIQCRGGRSSLVVGVPSSGLRAGDDALYYAIDSGEPVVLAVGAPPWGGGLAIRGDIVRFLASLPEQGDVTFRIVRLQGATTEGRYGLTALKAVLRRMAGPCKWAFAENAARH